jgi:uncharacterized protein
VCGALFFFFWGQGGSRGAQPVYEELHVQPSRLQKCIGRIDRAIHEVLHKGGVVEKDILFTDVEHRTEEGVSWDYTEIKVLFAGEPGRLLVEQELISEMGRLAPSVEFWRDAEASDGIAFRVYVLDRLTHRVVLVKKGSRHEPAPVERLPRVAIIIDDIGYDLEKARAFMSIDMPLTLAVLPMAPSTADIVGEARRKGVEIMLHLPMEPKGYPALNPGPGALLNSMGCQEIRKLLVRHLDEIPEARGVNNHMGSSFTEWDENMTVLMEEIGRRGLFFVDSRTSALSKGYSVARRMGVPAVSRNVFLDNKQSVEAISIQLERLLGVARRRGEAVGIAHPFPETLEVLRREAARLKRETRVLKVSELVKVNGR